MPQPLKDTEFDMSSLGTGYDPVAAMEESEGLDANFDPDADDDEGLSVAPPDEDGGDAEDDSGEDADADTSDEDTSDDKTAGEDSDESDDDSDDTADAEADGAKDDKSAKEEELVPGVDNATARETLKQKTQDRIRELANSNRETSQKLKDIEARYEQLQREAEKNNSGQSHQASLEQAAAEVDLDLDPEVLNSMWDKAIDGDYKTATSTFTDIIKKVATQAATQATQSATQATRKEQQMTELNSTVDELTTEYSVLDHDSADFDESLALEVRDLRDFFITQKGMAPGPALRRAAERELSARGVWGQESILNDAPETSTSKAKATQAHNQKQAKAKASVKQPAAPQSKAETGKTPTKSIEEMSDEEFDQLSNDQLEAMVGTAFR